MFDRKQELEVFLPQGITIHKDAFCNKLLSKYHGSAESIKTTSSDTRKYFPFSPKKLLGKINKAYAAWLVAMLCPSLNEEFDTIVDYYGQTQLYYMVEKLKAKKKVTFFHNDYAQFSTYKDVDKYYFKRVDQIFTISQTCVDSIKSIFPIIQDKVSLMENITSPKVIERLASDNVPIPEHEGLLIVSVGHVCQRKGSDWAIEAAHILKNRGYKFLWIIVGSCDNPSYQQAIQQYGIQNNMLLWGETTNPYPIMKTADIIVHPSRFEGKSIVLDEAKILCKPIVVTNFSTVTDQFTNGINATICDMNPESLSIAVAEMIDNDQLRERYSGYLKDHIYDNSSEVNKLYKIFDL